MSAEILNRENIFEPGLVRGSGDAHIFFSLPCALSEIDRHRGLINALARKLLDHLKSISCPDRNIRVAVHEKSRLSDLEDFFSLSPRSWLQLSVECQSESGIEAGVQRVLESLGYRCAEWIGVEGSESQLGAFCLGPNESPSLILYIRNRRSLRHCDILIPELL